jgi:von Willebrand factor type D domain.
LCDYRFNLADSDFQNQTRGLFGNWSHDITDDFTLPDGLMASAGSNINNFESIHKGFALNCEYTNT